MATEIAEASYRAIPSLSPYTRTDRYATPKEDHKTIARKLHAVLDVDQPRRVVDVGCGNGELLYHLKQTFDHWSFTGFDYTREFIDTAKGFPGLAGVRFDVQNLFDIAETFDVVLCTGVANTFPTVSDLLAKLIEICEPGGLILVDGRFNKHDVEVQVRFCDNTKPDSRGVWRSDFNQHSRRSVAALLEGKVASFEFEDMVMDKDIPFDPNKPGTFCFTFRDAEGRNLITNGLNIIINKTLLTIRR